MIFTKSDYEYKKYLVAEITGIVTEFHFMQLKKLNTSEIYPLVLISVNHTCNSLKLLYE